MNIHKVKICLGSNLSIVPEAARAIPCGNNVIGKGNSISPTAPLAHVLIFTRMFKQPIRISA